MGKSITTDTCVFPLCLSLHVLSGYWSFLVQGSEGNYPYLPIPRDEITGEISKGVLLITNKETKTTVGRGSSEREVHTTSTTL